MLAAAPAFAAPRLAAGIAPAAVSAALQAQAGGAGSEVGRFYRDRQFRPAWLDDPAADLALAAMQGAAADGLDPGRYIVGLPTSATLPSAEAAARTDIAFTVRLLRYAHNLRRGAVDPERADDLVGLSRPGYDPVTELEAALDAGRLRAWLAGLAPAHPEYAALKAALAKYRANAAQAGEWPVLPTVRKIELKAGNPLLALLQRRLAIDDPSLREEPAEPDVLEAAVKRFQAANGLETDGVVGAKTIAALNVPPSERVLQIEANMERWRWLPHSFPPRYVAVNAADTTLKAVADGKVVLASRVIAGKPKTATAIFNAEAIAITVNPPWKVPRSIIRKEILPKLARNPGYLAKHNMVMAAGEVTQRPGPDNSLGQLKVEMPNPFTMYLHDTNAKSLFARDERHLSHGCMRVQAILPLASWLLTGDTQKGLERIQAAIAEGQTRKIALDRPVPIFVLYWTAIPLANGSVEFRPDVYGRDARLIAALGGHPLASEASLAPVESGCKV